jgi:UDP-N-acetylglucosamine--N-acetylmuramyl-(pentapeptide) pyrophosphoryl-undecaprenol N-acetylglucosamine transferase
MRVLITGGGTGGHLYPALSVAGLLQELDNRCQILFVGTGEGLESRVVPERGYSFRQITAGKWPSEISAPRALKPFK